MEKVASFQTSSKIKHTKRVEKRIKSAERKSVKVLRSPGGRTDNPKTAGVVVEAAGREVVVAVSGVTVRRKFAPGTAPQQPSATTTTCYPGAAINRRTIVIVMPMIGAPFPYVAVHIVETKIIWLITSHLYSFSTKYD